MTIFEVCFGLEMLPDGKRRTALVSSFDNWLNQVVQQRIVAYDELATRCAAGLTAERQRKGRSGELRDTMVAGIILASKAKLATRNGNHFEDIVASVVNSRDPERWKRNNPYTLLDAIGIVLLGIQCLRRLAMSGGADSTHTKSGGFMEKPGKADDGVVNDSLGTVDLADSTGLDEDKETGDAKKNNKPTHED